MSEIRRYPACRNLVRVRRRSDRRMVVLRYLALENEIELVLPLISIRLFPINISDMHQSSHGNFSSDLFQAFTLQGIGKILPRFLFATG